MEEASSDEAYSSSSSSFFGKCRFQVKPTAAAHGDHGTVLVPHQGSAAALHYPYNDNGGFCYELNPSPSYTGKLAAFSVATPAHFGSKEQELQWYRHNHRHNHQVTTMPAGDGMMMEDVEQLIPLLQDKVTLGSPFFPTKPQQLPPSLSLLLQQRCGGQIDKRDQQGNTALMWAAIEGREDLVLALIRAGSDVNMQNFNGENALMFATSKGSERLVILLLQCGANPNIRTLEGATALHLAAYLGFDRIVSVLCEHGAHVNSQDEAGDTAIHWAVRRAGNDLCVQKLLNYGADINALNEDYESALALAKSVNEDQMVGVLLSLGATA